LRKEDEPMGVKKVSKLVSVLIAFVMIITSAIGVFAVDSPKRGLTTIGKVKNNRVVGQLEVVTEAQKVTYSVSGSDYVKLEGNMITGLKAGNTVIVKNEFGDKSYRWMRTVKISQKKKGAKCTWTKLTNATGYQLWITNKSGKVTKKTVGKKVTSYKLKAGYKLRVRPLKRYNSSIVYLGIQSATYKVK
jgi:hypothetical protein